MALPEIVVKRDGTEEKFSKKKIERSIHHALVQARTKNHQRVHEIGHSAFSILERKKKKKVTAQEIHNAVRKALVDHKLKNVAKAYDLGFLRVKGARLGKVKKRSGKLENFDTNKLFKSVCKATHRAHTPQHIRRCEDATKQIIRELARKFKGKTMTTEDIKQTAAEVLKRKKMPRAAKHYAIHRYF